MKKLSENKTWKEFKEFIAQGNILDMAISFVMGTAFKAIVTSLVDNILMPLLGVAMGGKDFSTLSIPVGSEEIAYGMFIQSIIDFLIIAICLFFILKMMTILTRRRKAAEAEAAAAAAAEPPAKSEDILLLEEIRDLLKK
jgi:large conductance mechanosensitive channel